MRELRSGARPTLGALAAVLLCTTALVTLTSASPVAAGPGCSASTIEVSTNTDAALRAAFTTASALAGPQTICINSGVGTITLAGTELVYNAVVTPGLTLQGNGATISGNNASRVLNIGSTLTLDGVTLTGANTAAGFGGAAFVGGNATLIDSTISGNTATVAGGTGGIFANGSLTLTSSSISGNTVTDIVSGSGGAFANGNVILTNSSISGNTAATTGAVFANGNVTLTSSTVSGNTGTAASSTGGVSANGNVTVSSSTISGNTAAIHGGINANGNVTLTSSTLNANTATALTGTGGGVFANGFVTLVYATVVDNSAPIGANLNMTGVLTSFGSVVAQGAGGGANCVALSTTSNGFNFTNDASGLVSCRFNAGTDLVGAANAAQLGAIADNGGPTLTRLPLTGSPLIGAIPAASCQADGAAGITTDQRGLARPALVGCDIGAVEVQPAPVTTTTSTPTTSTTLPLAVVPAAVNARPAFTG
jgi:hypothetical protein